MIIRNRSPIGPRYRLVRAPQPDVYLTDVLIDIVLVWKHGLRCLGAFLAGICRGAMQEAHEWAQRGRTIEEDIALAVAKIEVEIAARRRR